MNKMKSRTSWFNIALFVAAGLLCATGSMRDWVAALMMSWAAGAFTVSSLLKLSMQIKNGVQVIS